MLGEIVEDRYLVEAALGEGAMGCVYRARHIKVGRQVAIKVMHRELATSPAIVERFAREAMIAARLRHPNLVSVLDIGMTREDAPMIVLELAPGTTLSHLIEGPLLPTRVIALVRQLLRGLDHAHTAGLIHRDLKPDNILVECMPDGTEVPRIVDFGIAVTRERDDTVAGRRLTEANMVIGTPIYMSPEQARAKELDPRSDLFSLGVITYELLAGMPPFPGTTIDVALANASKDPPSILERAGVQTDPLLEAFARKLMARDPDARFASARAALDMLDLIERDRTVAATAMGCGAPSGAAQAVVEPSASASLPSDSDALPTRGVTLGSPLPQRRARRAAARIAMLALPVLAAAVLVIAVKRWSAAPASATPASATPSIELAGAANDASDALVAARASSLIDVRQAQAEAVGRPDSIAERHAAEERDAVAIVRADVQARQPGGNAANAPSDRAPRFVGGPNKLSTKIAGTRSAVVVAATHEAIVAKAAALTAAQRDGSAVVTVAQRDGSAAVTAAQPNSAAELAKRYAAVGRALRGAPDELWARYRRIRINAALATSESRRATAEALGEIERALR